MRILELRDVCEDLSKPGMLVLIICIEGPYDEQLNPLCKASGVVTEGNFCRQFQPDVAVPGGRSWLNVSDNEVGFTASDLPMSKLELIWWMDFILCSKKGI